MGLAGTADRFFGPGATLAGPWLALGAATVAAVILIVPVYLQRWRVRRGWRGSFRSSI